MPIEAHVCPRCGAPLPRPSATSPFSSCAYCGSTLKTTERTPTLEKDSASPSTSTAELHRRSREFVEAVKQAFAAGMAPLDAVRAGAAAHLGPLGECDGVARVAVAIAYDFDQENGTRVQADAMALSRIVEAYLKALPELHAEGEAALNLPFLAASASGPQHLQRTLTPAVLEALASREVRQPAPPPASMPEDETPPPKKKGWWPF